MGVISNPYGESGPGLVAVAQELEHITSEDRELPRRDRLLRRAMRIRERLHR